MITTAPVTVLADDREKAPYDFAGLGEVYVVRQRLLTGDYSLPFLEDKVAVSRKSLSDLYATVLDDAHRLRFIDELKRMDVMPYACVVVEQDWRSADPPDGRHLLTRMTLNLCVGMLFTAHGNVEWRACEGRRDAEIQALVYLVAARERLTVR